MLKASFSPRLFYYLQTVPIIIYQYYTEVLVDWIILIKCFTIFDPLQEICEESEEAMDYISKAMVSSQMNKITKGLGLFDNDTNENKRYTYDPKKEREEEKRLAQKK